MLDDARFWGAVIGLMVVGGNKALDSTFKVIDRLIDHYLDKRLGDEENDHEQ